MKKILIPLLALVPVIIYLKLRKPAGELTGTDSVPENGKADPDLKNPEAEERIQLKAVSNEPKAAKAGVRCKAVTASGKKCTRKPLPGAGFCWQHSQTVN